MRKLENHLSHLPSLLAGSGWYFKEPVLLTTVKKQVWGNCKTGKTRKVILGQGCILQER